MNILFCQHHQPSSLIMVPQTAVDKNPNHNLEQILSFWKLSPSELKSQAQRRIAEIFFVLSLKLAPESDTWSVSRARALRALDPTMFILLGLMKLFGIYFNGWILPIFHSSADHVWHPTVAMPNVWWIRMFDYFQVPMTCSAYFLAIYWAIKISHNALLLMCCLNSL